MGGNGMRSGAESSKARSLAKLILPLVSDEVELALETRVGTSLALGVSDGSERRAAAAPVYLRKRALTSGSALPGALSFGSEAVADMR